MKWEYIYPSAQRAETNRARFEVHPIGETFWLLTFSLGDSHCEREMIKQPLEFESMSDAKGAASLLTSI